MPATPAGNQCRALPAQFSTSPADRAHRVEAARAAGDLAQLAAQLGAGNHLRVERIGADDTTPGRPEGDDVRRVEPIQDLEEAVRGSVLWAVLAAGHRSGASGRVYVLVEMKRQMATASPAAIPSSPAPQAAQSIGPSGVPWA